MKASRSLGLISMLAVLFGVFLGAAPAQANTRYAALVMNADTGDVLYARNSEMRRYPASLTKVMTLYMLFEAIDDGRLAMDDQLHVSSRADRQPASDLGIEAGSTISVEDAIQALVVRSANDVAVVVAEALADSEWEFGRAMTRRAHEMGMRLTRFENASGLPHARQQTTARDLGLLTMRIVQDFPQHMHYFSQASFTYNDRTWSSHNNLLENYEGTTGLKTGYIRASGFNLIATVDREGHSLIGIVMGGRTSSRRDREMERILDLNFARLDADPHFGSRVFSSNIRPELRPAPSEWTPPVDDGEMLVADMINVTAMPTIRPTPPLPAAMAAMPSPNLRPELEPELNAMGETEALTALLVEGVEDEQKDDEGIEVAALNVMTESIGDTDAQSPLIGAFPQFFDAPASPAEWGVTVGTFTGAERADHNLRVTAAVLPTMLTWGMAALFPDSNDGEIQFDAAFGPMTEADAVEICAGLAREGHDCLPAHSFDWDSALRR